MKKTADMVNHPNHYNKGNKMYEPYKVIQEWGCNFNIGSAIKYLARYENKWNPIEDLKKAKQYIDFEIERLEKTNECDTTDTTTDDDRKYDVFANCKVLNGENPQKDFSNVFCEDENEVNESTSKNIEEELDNIIKTIDNSVVNRVGEILNKAVSAIENDNVSVEETLRNILGMNDDEIQSVLSNINTKKVEDIQNLLAQMMFRKILKNDSTKSNKPVKYFTKLNF